MLSLYTYVGFIKKNIYYSTLRDYANKEDID